VSDSDTQHKGEENMSNNNSNGTTNTRSDGARKPQNSGGQRTTETSRGPQPHKK
jgi:hypothetical protein